MSATDVGTLINEGQCFACYAPTDVPGLLDLALWARLAGVSISAPAAPVTPTEVCPVAFKENAATKFIQWTWNSTDPDNWLMEGSEDQTNWSFSNSELGSLRQMNGHHDFSYWRIVGRNSANENVTCYSNILSDS